MAQNIKVGDTIRYLNASGGGVVKRIERGVAWVEGPDGFELPTPIHECVVVDSRDTFVPAYKPPVVKRQEPTAQQPKSSVPITTPPTTEPAEETEQDLSFVVPLSKGPWFDRSGGEQLQVHVAYLPVSYEHFGQSPYETYLINESNYHLLFTYSTTTSAGGYKLRSAGVLEPDMRVLVEEFDASEINDHAVSHFQFVAYKPERTYRSMPPVERQVRMDVVKLVKRHAFRENPFFDEDALVIPVLEAYDGTQQAPAEEPAPAPTPATNRRGALPQRAIERAEQATATQKAPQKAPQKPTKKSVAKPQPEAKRPETPAAPQAAPAAPEQTIEKVGLEAERILPNATGMTPHEVLLFQLKNFRRELDKRLDRRGSKVIFIHGAGQGVLHQLIINRIEQDYPMVQYRDVTFDGFPMGAIEITISAK